MGSALPWVWFRETDEDGCGLRSSSDAFMQGSFSWDPHPALAYEQTRVYVSGNTLQIAGTGLCEETRLARVLGRPAVGEMRSSSSTRLWQPCREGCERWMMHGNVCNLCCVVSKAKSSSSVGSGDGCGIA